MLITSKVLQKLLRIFLDANSESKKANTFFESMQDFANKIFQYMNKQKSYDYYVTRQAVLGILAIDSLIFNIYSKCRNTEANNLGPSIHRSTSSVNTGLKSQTSFDAAQKAPDMPLFLEFFQMFIDSSRVFDTLDDIVGLFQGEDFFTNAVFAVNDSNFYNKMKY